MTFFKTLMRVVSAAVASAAVIVVPKVVEALIALFQGPAPSDISTPVWGAIGAIVVFVLNFVLGKIGSREEE